MPHDDARREVGDEAVWSLSTAKPGNGVDQLRDSTLRVALRSHTTRHCIIPPLMYLSGGNVHACPQTMSTRTGSRTAASRT